MEQHSPIGGGLCTPWLTLNKETKGHIMHLRLLHNKANK